MSTGVFRRPFFRTPPQAQFGLGVLSSGGTDVVVQPSVGSLVITGQVPTVAANVGIDPSTGALAITGYAPTVTATVSVTVTPDTGSLVITGYAPNVFDSTVHVTVNTLTGSLAITGYAPSVFDGFYDNLDPGYGPNGERLDPPGYRPVQWQAQSPFLPVNPGNDVWSQYPVGVEPPPTIDQNDEDVWTNTETYGYVAGGERRDVAGAATWAVIEPPLPMTQGEDVYSIYPLGVQVVPAIDQDDEETWKHIYLGGVV